MTNEIEEEINQARRPEEELVYSSLGTRKMQLLRLPVEDRGTAFELSITKDEWILSKSQAWMTEKGPLLKGYEVLKCPSDAIGGIYKKLTNFTMPFFLPHLNVAGVGSDSYEVSIWGGIYQSVTLRWWSDAPGGGWKPYTDLVLETIEFFEALPVNKEKSRWWEK